MYVVIVLISLVDKKFYDASYIFLLNHTVTHVLRFFS